MKYRIRQIKQDAQHHIKNIMGWRTRRRIIVFAVDDYGNIRVDSRKSRNQLDRAGQKKFLRFDEFDAIENRQDLEFLFETLDSVRDSEGSPAKFTAFSVPCNIDFERIRSEGFAVYRSELLPVTFSKLSQIDSGAYAGTWDLWKEGISKGFLFPQFHGREHINLKVFNEKMRSGDKEVLTDLEHRSYTSISSTGYSTIDWSAAFDFWELSETEVFGSIISEGLDAFEEVFGFRAQHFNSPGSSEYSGIHRSLVENGIKYLDTPFLKREHLGNGKYKIHINYLGRKPYPGLTYNVRNVLFEPTEPNGIDWVQHALRQIEVAFRWNHPAVISSHRVNFCGHIDERNREKGLKALRELLKAIVKRWPDAEFMNSVELMELVTE